MNAIIRNPFDAGGYSLTEMTQAINILPILWTRLGEMGLFAFEGVTQRTVIIEQGDGALNVLPSVPLGAPATGPLIRSKNGFCLAIPTPAAGKFTRGGSITPGEWERCTGLRLRFIYRRRGPSLLVAEGRLNTKGRAFGRLTRPHRGHGPASPSRSKTGRGVVTAPIFLLVPQVRLPKRLDLVRDAERAVGVPGLIVANWVKQ